jgi:hypothetical protein
MIRRWAKKAWPFLKTICIVLVLGVIALTAIGSSTNAVGLAAVKGQVAEANAKLIDNGLAPIPDPVPGLTGTPGTPGPAGLDGQDGQDGTDGRPPSTSEIAAAIVAYCETYECTGPAGADGADGVDGANGQDGVNGSDGSPGSPGTTGPVGPSGPQGPAGNDGKSVTAVECLDDGTWRITYSDSSTSTTPGPCRVVIAPTEPEETPDPFTFG